MAQSDMDPQAIARAVAIATAERPEAVGDFVEAHELDDHVVDFRFAAHKPGYEGWQWSVTLFHDEDADRWTVDESTLAPTADALLAPAWVPWKDRLEPDDLSVTDSIGTEPDDPRLEDGVTVQQVEAVAARVNDDAQANTTPSKDVPSQDSSDTNMVGEQTSEADTQAESGDKSDNGDASSSAETAGEDEAQDSPVDFVDIVQQLDLSRRHVMSPLGRSQTAKRWYEGPHGPKSLSTKTAEGHTCETCGFFIPLQGELTTMFGVCANRWSPDDGRVVSLDHGCGEHSEIDPPEPTHLWIQTKPAFDDMHIDIVAQRSRDERSDVELIESVENTQEQQAQDTGIETVDVPQHETVEQAAIQEAANDEAVLDAEHITPVQEPADLEVAQEAAQDSAMAESTSNESVQ